MQKDHLVGGDGGGARGPSDERVRAALGLLVACGETVQWHLEQAFAHDEPAIREIMVREIVRVILACPKQDACYCPCCATGIEAPHEYHLEKRQMRGSGEMPQWRPIETAPKWTPGTEREFVLLWCPNAYNVEHIKVGYVEARGAVYSMYEATGEMGSEPQRDATHWMPRLAPPQGGAA